MATHIISLNKMVSNDKFVYNNVALLLLILYICRGYFCQ